MSGAYSKFLETKRILAPSVGVETPADSVHPMLFDFQRDLVRWALRKGRAAIFADTGLGKTFMQLEWARLTNEKTLILAPLAVSQQTITEAEKLGIEVTYAKTQSQAGPITVTNYERLDNFDPSVFGAVVLDESSILKSFDGKTRTQLIQMFHETPYRLCCTATPAPNDIAEIANHAEFLGLMTRVEMLASFFVNDEGWRLKRHAFKAFYRWLASWGMSIKKPSDLGYPDDGYDLPDLSILPAIVEAEFQPEGQLFVTSIGGTTGRMAVRKSTVAARVQRAVGIIRAEPDERWIAWCGLNDEADALARVLHGSINVKGSDKPEFKEQTLKRFAAGELPILISKPSIAGFGMNFQTCARMVFVGLGDSYETYYQAIRRCWRFGQTRPVDAHVVLTDLEEPIYRNVLRKEREAATLSRELVANVAEYERSEIANHSSARLDYQPQEKMEVPAWLS